MRTFRVTSPPPLNIPVRLVKDLIIPSRGVWNTNLLMSLFNAKEKVTIEKISIMGQYGEDMLVWHFDKNGFLL